MEGQALNRNRLLNAQLSHAIASMGHGDLMIVCDAGFPIPSSAWRIDLAISPDVPDLATVLTPISENLIVERLSYADTLPEYNAPLLATLRRRRTCAGEARGNPRRDRGEGQGDRSHRR